jgi:hypothetical protein
VSTGDGAGQGYEIFVDGIADLAAEVQWRNQCSKAMVCSTTQPWTPMPEPCGAGYLWRELGIFVVLLGSVGVHGTGTPEWLTNLAAHQWCGIDQG